MEQQRVKRAMRMLLRQHEEARMSNNVLNLFMRFTTDASSRSLVQADPQSVLSSAELTDTEKEVLSGYIANPDDLIKQTGGQARDGWWF
jgi:hypothetical protein